MKDSSDESNEESCEKSNDDDWYEACAMEVDKIEETYKKQQNPKANVQSTEPVAEPAA